MTGDKRTLSAPACMDCGAHDCGTTREAYSDADQWQATAECLERQVEAYKRGAAQSELLRRLPLPQDVELLIARAKAWHEWRAGYGGLKVHATESDLFDAVEALDR